MTNPALNPTPTAGLPAFDYQPTTRVLFGAGVVSQVGEVVSSLSAGRVLLVTDAGLKQAGHEQRVLESLAQKGIDVAVYDHVRPNPTSDDVRMGFEFARSHEPDLIIALGGGSSMDAGKGINFLLTNGGEMKDYKGIGKATKPMLPFVAIPTTSGTGSEAQSFAVIADPVTHLKMACGDKKAMAKVAILDPELTVTMPMQVTVMTGIDAISHAVETYVTRKRTPVSQMFSRTAWRLLIEGFPKVLSEPGDLDARGKMLLGAHFAGLAIENSMLGAAHATANPLTAHFDMVHGCAVGLMLPYVVRINKSVVEPLYRELAVDAGLCEAYDEESAEKLAEFLSRLSRAAKLPTTLAQAGVSRTSLVEMAGEASDQWTGTFNPRPMTRDDYLALYEHAFNG